MKNWDGRLPVLVVGGGMISQEVILPTLFQEQKRGRVGMVSVASRRSSTLVQIAKAFDVPAAPARRGEATTSPKNVFRGYPKPGRGGAEVEAPECYKKAMADLEKCGLVIVATPDHLHTPVVLEAIQAGRHVVCQKPLCLKVADAHQIADAASAAGIYVLTDYHKRHDRAVRAVRHRYRKGDMGEMIFGHAWIEERREMPLKWFARWCHKSSSFEYIGVHYADAYYYITGLKPKRVIAFAQKKLLPTLGKDAYDAVQAVIVWENGSAFWIQTSWVCAEHQTALTNQGLQLSGTQGEYWADHKNRNLYFCTQKGGFEHYNPNFFKEYDDWDSDGQVQCAGYGYDSIVQGLDDIRNITAATMGLSKAGALKKRQEMIRRLEPHRALPSQALIGTAINEAVRISMENGSRGVVFDEQMFPRLADD